MLGSAAPPRLALVRRLARGAAAAAARLRHAPPSCARALSSRGAPGAAEPIVVQDPQATGQFDTKLLKWLACPISKQPLDFCEACPPLSPLASLANTAPLSHPTQIVAIPCDELPHLYPTLHAPPTSGQERTRVA